MEFKVLSRAEIEAKNNYKTSHIIISISTPHEKAPSISTNSKTKAILRIQFYDACNEIPNNQVENQAFIFNESHADKILTFVRENQCVDTVIVHCDAGMSRSPGVAAALTKLYDGDDTNFFKKYFPNSRVYHTILNTYHSQSLGS